MREHPGHTTKKRKVAFEDAIAKVNCAAVKAGHLRLEGQRFQAVVPHKAGQLQLNAFLPLAAVRLLDAASQLEAATTALTERCIRGITADEDRLAAAVERSIGLATALAPRLGYAAAASLAKDALLSDRTIPELALERGLVSRSEIWELLAPPSPESLQPSTTPRST